MITSLRKPAVHTYQGSVRTWCRKLSLQSLKVHWSNPHSWQQELKQTDINLHIQISIFTDLNIFLHWRIIIIKEARHAMCMPYLCFILTNNNHKARIWSLGYRVNAAVSTWSQGKLKKNDECIIICINFHVSVSDAEKYFNYNLLSTKIIAPLQVANKHILIYIFLLGHCWCRLLICGLSIKQRLGVWYISVA